MRNFCLECLRAVNDSFEKLNGFIARAGSEKPFAKVTKRTDITRSRRPTLPAPDVRNSAPAGALQSFPCQAERIRLFVYKGDADFTIGPSWPL